jgi:hypothetical protein
MHCLNELTDLQDIRTLEDLAALHGQQEAETDYVEGSRNLDLRSFDLEGWLSLVATDETGRALMSIATNDPVVAKGRYCAPFTTAYRATMQRLVRQDA